MKSTRMGWVLWNGGSISAISIAVIPIDHTSAFNEATTTKMKSVTIEFNEGGYNVPCHRTYLL